MPLALLNSCRKHTPQSPFSEVSSCKDCRIYYSEASEFAAAVHERMAAWGKKGGQAKSERKTRAARRNAKRRRSSRIWQRVTPRPPS